MRRPHLSAVVTLSFAVSLTLACSGTPGATTFEDGGPDDSQTIVIGAAGSGGAGGSAAGGGGTAGGAAGSACGSPSDGLPLSGLDGSSFSEPEDASFDEPSDPSFPDGAEAGFEGGGARSCPFNAFLQGGVCVCLPMTLTACDDGCVDLTMDDANCGACGRACPATSACEGGHCGLALTSVVPAAPGCGTLTLAFSDTTLYYTDSGHGTVNSVVPSVVGPPTVIASGEAAPGAIVVSGSTLFWIDSALTTCDTTIMTKGTIRMINSPGGAPTSLVSEVNSTGGIRGLAVSPDGSSVYYSAGSKIRKVPAAGGAAVDVAQETPGDVPTALAFDGQTVAYPTDVNADVDVVTPEPGKVASCGQVDQFGDVVDQVNCERLARSQGGLLLTTILLLDQTVYWANVSNIESSNIESSNGAPDGGRDQPIVSSVFGGTITALSGTPTALYFGGDDIGTGPSIERADLGLAEAPARLARDQAKVMSIAVGPTRVYWSTSACVINGTSL